MKPVIELDGVRVFQGDCRDVLRTLPDNSVDSVVTDPPYGLNFMGKEWDNPGKMVGQMATGHEQRGAFAYGGSHSRGYADNNSLGFQLWATEWAVECLRVLKPGGHLLAFGGTRTWHRLAVAIEDAGFEIRDNIAWMYGSGFPKSLDVSKAIDKKAGAERQVSGITKGAGIGGGNTFTDDNWKGIGRDHYERFDVPASEEAIKWQGWGTALKPAFEPIVVARKPLSGTVAETVLEWGTGGLNIDGSRIGTTVETWPSSRSYAPGEMQPGHSGQTIETGPAPAGRWPANVILDEYTAQLLDEQSGVSVSKVGMRGSLSAEGSHEGWKRESHKGFNGLRGHNDSGGASRFFYVAKASKRDRNEGLEDLEAQRHADRNKDDGAGGDNPRNRTNQAKQNFHPTVKPTALMRYLVKLVTPPGGTVLDPFTGSGSTGKAALLEGFEFVGVELTEDYLPIIEGRLKWALENREEETLF